MTCTDFKLTTVYLHQWINHRICEDLTGLMIHGGCGTFKGKRFILCGDKGAGKTSLLCRLLFEGVQVHSDEMVFLDNDGAEPFPGKFHLKEGTIPLVPPLRASCLRLRPYPALSKGGGSFFFFDPSDIGLEWGTSRAKVDVFFYLEPGRLGGSRIVSCPKFMMVGKILGQTLNLEGDPRPQIRRLCRAVDAGICYDLRVDDLSAGARMIRDALCYRL